MFLVHGPQLSCKKEQTNQDGKKAFGYLIKIWFKSDKTACSHTGLTLSLNLIKNIQKKTHLKISRKDKYLQQRRLALSVPWRYFFLFKAKEHMALKIQNDHVTSSMTGLLSVILRPTGYWMPHDLYWFTCSFPPSPA